MASREYDSDSEYMDGYDEEPEYIDEIPYNERDEYEEDFGHNESEIDYSRRFDTNQGQASPAPAIDFKLPEMIQGLIESNDALGSLREKVIDSVQQAKTKGQSTMENAKERAIVVMESKIEETKDWARKKKVEIEQQAEDWLEEARITSEQRVEDAKYYAAEKVEEAELQAAALMKRTKDQLTHDLERLRETAAEESKKAWEQTKLNANMTIDEIREDPIAFLNSTKEKSINAALTSKDHFMDLVEYLQSLDSETVQRQLRDLYERTYAEAQVASEKLIAQGKRQSIIALNMAKKQAILYMKIAEEEVNRFRNAAELRLQEKVKQALDIVADSVDELKMITDKAAGRVERNSFSH
mmetsp:Transcript_14842/g.16788  ORF Transcript_14842/g.16788 Transcript_14842/m.16788 type:complete len:355 (+) Transcript_14842:184-1248(+)